MTDPADIVFDLLEILSLVLQSPVGPDSIINPLLREVNSSVCSVPQASRQSVMLLVLIPIALIRASRALLSVIPVSGLNIPVRLL